ncbi:MAG: alkaline phosphatase family protein [Acidobacteriota bacterium]
MATKRSGLAAIDSIVVVMLENRSFDHMLGYLYAAHGNRSPAGQLFDGLGVLAEYRTAVLAGNSPAQFECDLPEAQRDDVACRLPIVATFHPTAGMT